MNPHPATLLPAVCALARRAGQMLLEFRRHGQFEQCTKADLSPVTSADLAVDAFLKQALGELTPHWPVLTEEGEQPSLAERAGWSHYWLVDPLDGTGEFIAGSSDYATLIALVADHQPVLGVVYTPHCDRLYQAVRGGGAFCEQQGVSRPLQVRRHDLRPSALTVAVSRHQDLAVLGATLSDECRYEWLVCGSSSLKSCLVAEGRADCYVRLGPTGEWDTAAAQCIVEEAGGVIRTLSQQPLTYNRRESLMNPDFITQGDPALPWLQLVRPQ